MDILIIFFITLIVLLNITCLIITSLEMEENNSFKSGFIYWWELIFELPINIVGEIILAVLCCIIFLPAIIILIITFIICFIIAFICGLFLFIFKEDEDKKILRKAKRELKRLKKND